MNSPIYGTNPKKIHQPDFPISCNLRTRRATIGIKDIATNMPIRAKNGLSIPVATPNKTTHKIVAYKKSTNHQYSERVALPENVAYFE